MNFKPTKAKTITSISLPVLIWLYNFILTFKVIFRIEPPCLYTPGSVPSAACSMQSFYFQTFVLNPLALLCLGLIIYFIWSLFQKK